MNLNALWEQVQSSKDRTTTRLNVPGGWLYSLVEHGAYGSGSGVVHSMLVFVPFVREEENA